VILGDDAGLRGLTIESRDVGVEVVGVGAELRDVAVEVSGGTTAITGVLIKAGPFETTRCRVEVEDLAALGARGIDLDPGASAETWALRETRVAVSSTATSGDDAVGVRFAASDAGALLRLEGCEVEATAAGGTAVALDLTGSGEAEVLGSDLAASGAGAVALDAGSAAARVGHSLLGGSTAGSVCGGGNVDADRDALGAVGCP